LSLLLLNPPAALYAAVIV
jgi:hypothetical protein